MARAPMTLAGADRLREELRQMKTVDRPAVINAIAEARAHGDLKENAEYHAAREQQSFLEGRIAEIEDALARAQIIDPQTDVIQRWLVHGWLCCRVQRLHQVDLDLAGAGAQREDLFVDIL